MKRLSLTAWIFIAMVVGVAVGAAFPNVGKAEWMAALAERIPAPDQIHHRAR